MTDEATNDESEVVDKSTIIYKSPGQHRGPKGKTYSFRGLADGEKMPSGWHKTLNAAVKASKE